MSDKAVRRVAITGIGAVTPLGYGVNGLWDGILANRSGISKITSFDASSFRTQVAGEIKEFDVSAYASKKAIKRLDRFSAFAVAAARMAAEDSGLDLSANSDAGIVMGSALGGLGFAEEQHDVYRERGLKSVNPNLALMVFGASRLSSQAVPRRRFTRSHSHRLRLSGP